jgi:hypothetical protein
VLLAAVVLAGVAWLIVVLARRRRWDGRFTAALGEARWAATVLATSLAEPTLSADATTLYWNESRPRLQAVQDELEALRSTGPNEARRARADQVAGELTALTEAMSALVALRGAVPEASDSDLSLQQSRTAVHEHSRSLQDVIGEQPVPQSPPPPAEPPGRAGDQP